MSAVNPNNAWEIRNFNLDADAWTFVDLSGFWSFRINLVDVSGRSTVDTIEVALNPGVGNTSVGAGPIFAYTQGDPGVGGTGSAGSVFDAPHFPTVRSGWWVKPQPGGTTSTIQIIGVRRNPAK